MPMIGSMGAASARGFGMPGTTVIPVTNGLTTQLEAWKPTSYPGTGSTWRDLSGANNNATLVNSPTFTADYFQLNGTNQYIDLNRYVAASQSELTVIAYVTMGATTSGTMTIIDESNTDLFWQYALLNQAWYTRDTSTGPTGARNNDVTGYAATWFTANTRRMITTRYSVSGAFKRLTFDAATGSSFSSTTSIDQLTPVSASRGFMRIGFPYDGTYFNGRVHAVYVYTRAITDDEVVSIFNYVRK